MAQVLQRERMPAEALGERGELLVGRRDEVELEELVARGQLVDRALVDGVEHLHPRRTLDRAADAARRAARQGWRRSC
jgi:hypothetical protein